jgi:type II secretory pathway pseudopilin PulG
MFGNSSTWAPNHTEPSATNGTATPPPIPVPDPIDTPAFYMMLIVSIAAVVFFASAGVSFARQRRREQNRKVLEAMRETGGVAIGDEDDGNQQSFDDNNNSASIENGINTSGRARASPQASPLPGEAAQFPGDDAAAGPRVYHAPAQVGARKALPRYSSTDSLGAPRPRSALRSSSRVERERAPSRIEQDHAPIDMDDE